VRSTGQERASPRTCMWGNRDPSCDDAAPTRRHTESRYRASARRTTFGVLNASGAIPVPVTLATQWNNNVTKNKRRKSAPAEQRSQFAESQAKIANSIEARPRRNVGGPGASFECSLFKPSDNFSGLVRHDGVRAMQPIRSTYCESLWLCAICKCDIPCGF